MSIDHIGLIFFPEFDILRIIGRLALPIFAFGIVKGYKHTSNLKQYFFRLIIFAFISQIPYIFLIADNQLNIIFTLTMALIILYVIDKKKYFLLPELIFISLLITFEYGLYCIMMVLIFSLNKRKEIIILSQLILLSLYFLYYGGYIQLFSIFGILLVIYYHNNKRTINLHKRFFYFFYPSHLLLLLLIKLSI